MEQDAVEFMAFHGIETVLFCFFLEETSQKNSLEIF